MSDPRAPWGGRDDGRELVAGSLRGYRTWRLLPRGVAPGPGRLPLTSVTRPHVTWPPVLAASCTPPVPEFARSTVAPVAPTHRAPTAECSCGIYAWYSPSDARTFAAEVFGAVEASGLVLMGTRGFRAECARISAVATRNRRLAAACADAGIPVYRRRRDLVAAHPPDDVSTLVGAPPARSRQRTHPFALVICLSVWLRAALLMVATGVLPPAAIIGGVLASEALVIGLVVCYLRPNHAGGPAPAAPSHPPDP